MQMTKRESTTHYATRMHPQNETVNRVHKEPAEEAVRARAHQIYEARIADSRPGDALADWIQAERELRD